MARVNVLDLRILDILSNSVFVLIERYLVLCTEYQSGRGMIPRVVLHGE